MAHFLFAEWDGGGGLPAELAVARRLVAAGHTVTVLGEPVMEAEVRAAGVEDFRSWVEAPHRVSRRPEDDFIRDWEFRNPVAELDNMYARLMVTPAPLYAKETLAVIDDVHPDVVVSSFPLFGAQLAAEARGVPLALLAPGIAGTIAERMPPPGMFPAKGPLGRLRDRALDTVIDRLLNRGLAGLNAARRDFGLSPLRRLRDQYGRADRILVLTSAAFDFPGRLPANARYVGAQLDDPAWAQPWEPPTDDDRPFVLVAMSTTFMDHVEHLQRVVTALGRLDVRGLVTTGPAIDPDQIRAPDGVQVVRSAPHSAVLPHADVLVTHGGHGTLMKALVAGVPVVCTPVGRDQPENAARVVYHGAGVRVTKKKASPATIAAAVQRVLGDPSYRQAAARLGERIRADAEAGLVLTELEALAHATRR
jgi:MGT family glycosyltransferase